MPILIKCVAVCGKCTRRQEFETQVTHDGSPEQQLLRASEVDHEYTLPQGWTNDRRVWDSPIMCPECSKEVAEAMRRGMPQSGCKA